MRRCLSLIGLSLLPLCSFGASKEIVELQRDLATLQDQVRTMQTGTTEKLTTLTVLVQQTLDATNAANKAVAVLDERMNQRFAQEASKFGQPVAAVGAKVDQMSNDFASMRDALNDLVSRMGRLDQKLVEINKTLQTIQAPPPPPPALGPGQTSSAGGPPAIPPDTLYDSAMRDSLGGKTDLALREFSNYVQLYGDTDKASSAQYWIGKIFYDQGDYPNAVKNFDLVLERYGDSNKTPEAMFYKGLALVKLNQKTDGQKEFRSLLSKFPNSSLAPRACTELKNLGYNCSAAPAAKKKTRPHA
jgi:tol-pal system protein YbgF